MRAPQARIATVLRLILFFCVHFAATLGAPYYFSSAGIVTLFWPATGIALAGVLVGGYKYAFVTLLSCAVSGMLTPEKGMAQAWFSAANALEIFIARFWLLRIARIDVNFDKASYYMKFMVFAGVLLPVPAALVAAGAVTVFSPSAVPYWRPAAEWWMSDSLGILSITPLLLIWRNMPKGWLDKKRLAEAIAGIALTVASGFFLLSGSAEFSGAYPRAFIAFIFISWAASRFGRHATLLIIAIVFIQTLAAAYVSTGRSRHYDFANIWLFLVTLSTVGMSLATAFNERRTSLQRLHETLGAYRREEARRRASDNALKLSSIDFQRLVETAEEGIWTIDTEGKTTFANDRMAAMLGYSPEEMLGKNFLDYMPEADRKAGMERLSRRNSGDREGHDCDLVHKNGTRVETFMHTNPIKDIEGKISGALAMVTDVTMSKKTERALLESEDRFRKIAEEVSDGVVIHQAGVVLYANPAAVRLLGAPDKASIIGLNGIALNHPDARDTAVDRIRQAMNNPDGLRLPPFRRKINRLDGRTITMESIAITASYEGRPAVIVVGREVTDDTVPEEPKS